MAAALLAACAQETPEALLGSAKGYLAKKDAPAAVIQLKSALQTKPDLAEARFLLGRTLFESGDPVGAEVELRKAQELKYPEAAVAPPLARAMVVQGKGRRVIEQYAAVGLAEPAGNADLKVALATAYAQQGDADKAKAALVQALAAVPGYAPAILMQARFLAAEQKLDAALAMIEALVGRDPGSYEALQMKGDLLLFKGDGASAMEAQLRALAVRGDWLPAHSSILEMLLAGGDLAGARTQLDQLAKLLPRHPQTKYFEARLAYLNKDYKTARELVQQLLGRTPGEIKVLILGGRIALQEGSLAQAESLAVKAVQQAPDADVARRLLTEIYLRSGQPAKARETIARLLEKPNADAATLNLAGQAELQSGKVGQAETYFSRAAKLDPRDVSSRTALAVAHISKGDTDLGLDQLQEIAKSDQGTTADMAIIEAKLRQRDFRSALKAIDAMERKQPKKPLAAQLRGQVLLAQNEPAAARESFARAVSLDPLYFPAAASLAALDLRENKADDARKRFDKLLAADPKSVQVLLALAELRARAGANKAEVAGMLAEAIKLNPPVAAPRLVLIELHLRAGDAKAAVSTAQEAVAALPESVELLDALGRAQMASGNAEQAITTFRKLAALRQHSPEPLLRLAEAYVALKDVAGARESLNRALEIAPTFILAQRGLIMVEINAGRIGEAMAVARKVQAQRPNEAFGYLFAGDIEVFRKNWVAAAEAYRAALKRGVSTEIASKLHEALVSAKKQPDAEAVAAAWVKEHPQDAAFRTHLAYHALSRLDFPAAESQYLAVLKLQPDNALALNNLAWVTNKLKKPGSVELAEKANALRPDQPAFLDTLATVLADSGQARKAVEIAKKALTLAPGQPSLRLNLAKIYLKTGEKTLAKAELEELAKLGTGFPQQAEVGELLRLL